MTTIINGGKPVTVPGNYPFRSSAVTTRGPSAGSVELLYGDGRAMTYEQIVRSQVWVAAVVNKITNGLARLPLKTYMYEDADEDNRRRIKAHDLPRLLRRPRPRSTQFALKAHVARDMHVHGRALVVKFRPSPGSPPTELWPIPWRYVQAVEDGPDILGFVISIGGRTYPVGVEDTIHFELPGRMSPLEPLRRTLALEDAAQEFQGRNFENGITPRGAFFSPQKLDDKTMPRLRAELEGMYAGPENSGRFGLFDQDLKWAQMGSSAVDAALIDQRKLSREEVCGAFDIDPPLVGILERSTFSNRVVIQTAFYVDTLGSKVENIDETYQAQLVDDEPAWDGLFVESDMTAVLRPDPEALSRTDLMEQQSSTTGIDERRRRRNLPALNIPGVTDVPLIPVNMVPAGAQPDPNAGAADPDAGKDLVAAAFTAGLPGDSASTIPSEEAP